MVRLGEPWGGARVRRSRLRRRVCPQRGGWQARLVPCRACVMLLYVLCLCLRVRGHRSIARSCARAGAYPRARLRACVRARVAWCSTCARMCLCSCVGVCVFVHVCVCLCACMCFCVYVCACVFCVCISACACLCWRVVFKLARARGRTGSHLPVRVCVYSCVFVRE